MTDLSCNPQTVHIRKLPIQQNDLIIIPHLVMLPDHIEGFLAAHGPVSLNTDGIQRVHCRAAQCLIIIHHKHFPCGKNHIHLFFCSFFQIQNQVELSSLVWLTLHSDLSFHRIHDVLGNGHAKTGSLCLLHAHTVRPGI